MNILCTSADTFPEDLARFRHLMQISQKELGKKTNSHQQVISKLETRAQILDYEQVFDIARALGIDELRIRL